MAWLMALCVLVLLRGVAAGKYTVLTAPKVIRK